MQREEIKSFDIVADEVILKDSSLPFSYPLVADAVTEGGAYFGARQGKLKLPKTVTLTAVLNVTPLLMSYTTLLLVLSHVGAKTIVEINGHNVGSTLSRSRVYSFDVKNCLHLGENTLTLTMSGENFKESEYCISPFSIGACEIIAYSHARISTVNIREEMLDGRVRVHISLPDYSLDAGLRAVATLVSPGGRVYFCGMLGGYGSIDITEPNLWWPRGLGVQNLYRLTVNLYYDNEIIDSRDIKIGLVDYSLDEGKASSPALVASGTSVFARGACYLPDCALLPFLSEEKMRIMVNAARDMGMNTLVISDTGVYMPELFFTLCDLAGITVYQEINCGGDNEEKAREVIDNLLPAAYHPSFALVIYTGGEPSSELSKLLLSKCSVRLNSLSEIITVPKATLPTATSLGRFVPEGQMNIFSKTLEERTTLDDNARLISSVSYNCPHGISEIEYSGALYALDGLLEEINATRRSTRDKRHCILSTLTDPEPKISESLIDYYGRVKCAGFGIAELFADTYIGAVNNGTRVTFFISNEKRKEHTGRLEYSVMDASGRCIFRDGFEVLAPALSSVDILTVDLGEIVNDRLDECFVYYRLTDGFLTASSGTLFFVPSKRFKYAEPNVRTELCGNLNDFVLTVSSDAYAGRVYIELPLTDARLSNNMFDLADSQSARVEIKTAHAVAIEVLRRGIKVYTLNTLGKD